VARDRVCCGEVIDMYGWTHIVLLTDEDTSSTCWSVSQPVDEVIGHDDNYTLTWLRLGSLAERLAAENRPPVLRRVRRENISSVSGSNNQSTNQLNDRSQAWF